MNWALVVSLFLVVLSGGVAYFVGRRAGISAIKEGLADFEKEMLARERQIQEKLHADIEEIKKRPLEEFEEESIKRFLGRSKKWE